MPTDSTLKYLTRLCAGDLLPWLGQPDAQVVEVLSPELPATDRRLDNLLRLQDAAGTPSLHLIEWQGYSDPDLLWRVLEYLGLLGRRYRERPIRVSIIYLKPGDDGGDTLDQASHTVGGWTVQFHTIRLWEHTAQEALASGRPGLLALLPLLAGATPELVVQAAQTLLAGGAAQEQTDLLAALGALADRLLPMQRFLRLVTKERLMQSDLIAYLTQEKEAAHAAEKAALLQEKATLEERLTAEAAQRAAAEQDKLRTLQQLLRATISARFPEAPLRLMTPIEAISDPARLQALIPAVVAAPDLAAVEALLG